MFENPTIVIGLGFLFILGLALIFGEKFRAKLFNFFTISSKGGIRNTRIRESELSIKKDKDIDVINEDIDKSKIDIK